jgi:hypothetical protein
MKSKLYAFRREKHVNLKVKVTLEQAMKAQSGSRGIPLFFL